MPADGSVVIDTILKTDGINKGVGELQGKLSALGSKFTSMGKSMTMGLTTPLVGIGGLATKTFLNFDESMRRVAATAGLTANETDKSYMAMRNQAKELGSTTRFSASEVADGMNYMAMAGWNTEQTMKGIPVVLDLAAASGESLASTSDIVTDAMTAFGLKAEQASMFADVLAATSSNSNTNVGLLGETFKYAAPVAGALGYSVKDTAVAIGLMANAGIKGSQAGTALRAGLARLVDPPKEAAKELDKYGISIKNSDGTMKSFGSVMSNLREKLGGLTEAEKASAISSIFGQEAMSGWLSVINASDGDFNKLTNSINNSEGATKTMVETINGGIGGAWASFKSALEGVGIALGEALSPAVTKVIGVLTSLFTWLSNLSPTVLKVISVIGAIVAALGPLILILGVVMSHLAAFKAKTGLIYMGVSALKTGFTALSGAFTFLLSPIGLVVGAIVGLAAVFIYLWNTNETFRNKVIEIWNSIKAFIMPIVQTISNFIKGVWETLKSWWDTNQESILTKITETWNNIVSFVTPIIQSVVDFITTIWEMLKTFWSENQNTILSIAQTVWEAVKAVFTVVFGAIKIVVQTTMDIIKNIITIVLTSIKAFWDTWGTAIKTLVTTVWNVVKSIFEGTLKNILNIVTTVINQIKAIIDLVMNTIKSIINIVLSAIRGDWQGVLNGIRTLVSGFKDFVSRTFSNLMNLLRNLVRNGIDTVKKIFTSLKNVNLFEIGKNIIQGLINGIKNMIGAVGRAISEVAGNIKNRIMGALGIHSPSRWMKDMIGYNLGAGLVIGIDKTKRMVSKASDRMSEWMKPELPFNNLKFNDTISKFRNKSKDILAKMSFNPDFKNQPVAIINIHNGIDSDLLTTKVNSKNAEQSIINKLFERGM